MMDTAKPKLARFCEIIQTGAIAGLAAVPLVADAGSYRATPRLIIAATVLAPVALACSFWIARSISPERGFWGMILAIAFYLWALSIPVIF